MKKDKNYDKFIDAVDTVCGICYSRSEETCENCPVRFTVDNYKKYD